jgi:Xaa-Pro dipeptidase
MVFTIEPGLYDHDDFGVRIEDDVLITEQGSQSLTCFDKTLTMIG